MRVEKSKKLQSQSQAKMPGRARKLLKRAGIWLAALVFLATSCLLPYFSQSALAVTGGNVASWMTKAAQVQAATSVMKRCVAGEMSKTGDGGHIYGYLYDNTGLSENIFEKMGSTNIATGAWLEAQVQHKVDDGEIYCKNNDSNIINVFASALGISWQDVICNGDQWGIFYPITKSDGMAHGTYDQDDYAYTGACKTLISDSDFRFNWNRSGALDYIETLYDNYKAANADTVGQFLPDWDDVYNFTDKATAYYAYWNDFTTACNTGSSYKVPGDAMDEKQYWKVEYIKDDGTVETRYYSKNETGVSKAYAKKNWDNSIVGSGGAHSCDDIAAKLSNPDYYQAAQNDIKKILQDAIDAAEAAALERTKELCKAKALYATVELDAEGNITNKTGFANEPSAAYYYLQAKKILEDPDAKRAELVEQFRADLVAKNPRLTNEEIDALLAEKESDIDDLMKALQERAQIVYDKFDKVLSGAGGGTGDGNPETSYWYEGDNGAIMCTEFESFDGTIDNDSGYQDILDALLSQATGDEGDANTDYSQTGSTGGGDLAQCFTNASSLGWILCPVLYAAGQAAGAMYENIAEKWLKIDASEVTIKDSAGVYSGIYTGWSTVRDLANVAFVIAFLVIVFSQLTGFGVTNYGIKKMLPKLIAMAVIVNMSFFVCQILVDATNIVGNGIEQLFNSLPLGDADSYDAKDFLSGLLSTVGVTGIAVFAGVKLIPLAAAAITTPGAWLVPLLLGIFALIVSILFVYVLLAVRRAGIIALIIVAPLAIVCYTLPNAKSLFDKWKRLFTSLLLVYPICQAVAGVSGFVSSLMLRDNSESFVWNLVAMLLQFAPLFMVPTFVRASLALMGNIGARLTQMGQRFSRGATGLVRGTQWYKEHQEQGMHQYQQKRYQGIMNRLQAKQSRLQGKGKALSNWDQRRLARAGMAYKASRDEDARNRESTKLLNEDYFRNSEKSIAIEEAQKRVDAKMRGIMYGNEDGTLAQLGDAGSEFDVNPNDPGSIDHALDWAMNKYMTEGGAENEELVRALMQLSMTKGDTGQSNMVTTYRKFLQAAKAIGDTSDAAKHIRTIGNHIAGNDKWMGSIKLADPGSYAAINDSVASTMIARDTSGAPIIDPATGDPQRVPISGLEAVHSDADYNIMGSNKLRQGQVGDLGDSYWAGLKAALSAGGDYGDFAGHEDDLIKIGSTIRAALGNPQAVGKIKDEHLATMNQAMEAAHKAAQQKWVDAAPVGTTRTAADYDAQFGAFQKVEKVGQEFKVHHREMAMPVGWDHSLDGETKADGKPYAIGWVLRDGAGHIVRELTYEEAARAKAIEEHNAKAYVENNK